jgi:hypothetical protein
LATVPTPGITVPVRATDRSDPRDQTNNPVSGTLRSDRAFVIGRARA